MPDFRPDISYPVIIRRPNNPAFFVGFITEVAVKRTSTPMAAVPPNKNFTGCPDGVMFRLAVLTYRCHCRLAWRCRSIFPTIEFRHPAKLAASSGQYTYTHSLSVS